MGKIRDARYPRWSARACIVGGTEPLAWTRIGWRACSDCDRSHRSQFRTETWPFVCSGAPTCSEKDASVLGLGARLSSLLYWQPRFNPSLLSLGIMRHVGVAHAANSRAALLPGVSMRACAVPTALSILLGQQLRTEFFDLFRRNVQCSRNVGLAVAFGCKGLFGLAWLLVRSSVEMVPSILISLRITFNWRPRR